MAIMSTDIRQRMLVHIQANARDGNIWVSERGIDNDGHNFQYQNLRQLPADYDIFIEALEKVHKNSEDHAIWLEIHSPHEADILINHTRSLSQ